MNTKIDHQVISEQGVVIDTRSRLNTEESQVVRTAGYDGLIAIVSSPEREYALVEKAGSIFLLNSDNLYVSVQLSENKVVLFRDMNKNIIGSLEVDYNGGINLSGNGKDLYAHGQEAALKTTVSLATVALATV